MLAEHIIIEYITCIYVAYYYYCSAVEFFDSSRPLLEQELLEPEDEFSTVRTSPFLKMPHTVLKAW